MSIRAQQASKTRVLLVNTPTLGPLGADSWIHAQLIRTLDRSRFEVYVGCTMGPPDEPTPLYAAVSMIPDVHFRPVNFGRELFDLSGLRWVDQVLRNSPAIFSFGALALFVRRERIAIIHTVSRPRDALACVLLARITRRKCLIHMQLGYGDWMSRTLRWSLRHADGLVAISEFVAETLVAGGCDPKRIHLAYNAVVFEDWNPVGRRADARRELGLPVSAPLVLTVSRLYRGKGTAELLRAIALVRHEIPDVKLLVVGRDVSGGSFMRELQTIIEEEDLHDTVLFFGQRSDIVRFMAAADIFAMPSFLEPFGIVFTEAMAMKLPIVALNNGGTKEVVEHGKDGLLSEPGSIDTLANNLVTLLRDPALRERMGDYGREQVAKRFTIEHLAEKVAKIYARLARNP
jgi:glycosyltransferase involved in cell wall biosynthesis